MAAEARGLAVVDAGSVDAYRTNPSFVDQPFGSGGIESWEMQPGHALKTAFVGCQVFDLVWPIAAVPGLEEHDTSFRYFAVARFPGREILCVDLIIPINPCFIGDIDLHRWRDKLCQRDLIGRLATLCKVDRRIDVGTPVLSRAE